MRISVAFALGVCAGCGEGDPGLEDCAGELSGTYDGSDEGPLGGSLGEDGNLALTFYEPGGETAERGSATVTALGGVSGMAGDRELTGTFDFGMCAATGEWTDDGSGGGQGGWSLSR